MNMNRRQFVGGVAGAGAVLAMGGSAKAEDQNSFDQYRYEIEYISDIGIRHIVPVYFSYFPGKKGTLTAGERLTAKEVWDHAGGWYKLYKIIAVREIKCMVDDLPKPK